METSMETTTTISLWVALKNTSYAAVFLASTMYLGITSVSVEVLAGLIVTDVVCGILKAGTVFGWQSVRSSVLQRGVIAKALVMIVPMVLALVGRGVGIDVGFLAQSTINVLILSEAYSIIGNIYAIRTGNAKVEFDAVAYVLSSVKNILKKIIVEDTP